MVSTSLFPLPAPPIASAENPPFSYGRFWSLTPVLTTPYAITARSMGARPLMGRFSTSFMVIAWPAEADTVFPASLMFL